MSALPSPLKSPILTSTQATAGDHLPHVVLVKPEPVERPTHHKPVVGSRPMMSALPSPLKSPVCTSVQFTAGDQVLHMTDGARGSLIMSVTLTGLPASAMVTVMVWVPVKAPKTWLPETVKGPLPPIVPALVVPSSQVMVAV